MCIKKSKNMHKHKYNKMLLKSCQCQNKSCLSLGMYPMSADLREILLIFLKIL